MNQKVQTKRHLLLLLLAIVVILFFLVIRLLTDEDSVSPTPVQRHLPAFHQTLNFTQKKVEFLEKYGDKYGYNGKLETIRRTQTPQLDGLYSTIQNLFIYHCRRNLSRL